MPRGHRRARHEPADLEKPLTLDYLGVGAGQRQVVISVPV
jgi:hypothetical protein